MLTKEEIRRGLAENAQAPHGTARNVRAEELSAAAESTGDRKLLRDALMALIDAYEYSAERAKMLVPFARLLQEHDRDPAVFEGYAAHNLFWRFKWVTGSVVDSPEIPVEAVERWLADMERRYRLAGYSERAVREHEFFLADAVGDDERADRAVRRWIAAERDSMSDCHACELNTQGGYWVRRKDDAKALEVWEPVLAGRNRCLEEPHRVLAHSLLPLLRLGRADEARAHHLRGYRMARGNESLLRSIGEHIEFCALTGNESRGLEILADHAGHLGPLADADAQLLFAGGVLVLLRRLVDLGHGDRPAVAYQGATRSVSELQALVYEETSALADRFDVRNGSTRISDRLRERLATRPLVEFLPLGVRSPLLGQRRPAPVARDAGDAPSVAADTVPAAAGPAGRTDSLEEQVCRARELRDSGHPAATAAWDHVAMLLDRAGDQGDDHAGGRFGGTGLAGAGAAGAAPEEDSVLVADLLDHRALQALRSGDEAGIALLVEALAARQAAGQAAEAALVALRRAVAASRFGASAEETRALVRAAAEAADALDDADPKKERRVMSVEFNRIVIEMQLRDHPGEEGQGADAGTQLPADGSGGSEGSGGSDSSEVSDTSAGSEGPEGAAVGVEGAATSESFAERELNRFLAACARDAEGPKGAEDTAPQEAVDSAVPNAEAVREAAASAGLPGVQDIVGDAEAVLAQVVLSAGDVRQAAALFASAAAHQEAAARPWAAAEPLARRAELMMALGDPDEAERSARAALANAAEISEPSEQGTLRLVLAEILLRRGRSAESATHALDAAHWFDQAGESADAGARARLLLARAYGASGRHAEAAEILQSALPDLLEGDEARGVFARQVLADLLQELHDPRGAAEQLLQAAETAKGWDDLHAQASIAHSAADALSEARMSEEATAAYERALVLYRATGDSAAGEVRVLRALSWLAVGDEAFGPGSRSAGLMEQALAVLEEAEEPELRYEHARTHQQFGELNQRSAYELEDEDEDWDEDEDEEGEEGRSEEAEGAQDRGSAPGEDGPDADRAEGRSADSASEGPQDFGADGDADRQRSVLYREAIRRFEQAADLFAAFGTGALPERVDCLCRVAWMRQGQGFGDTAVEALTGLVAELRELDEEKVVTEQLRKVETVVTNLRKAAKS